jgi:polyisoprenoid-binding protein YceI
LTFKIITLLTAGLTAATMAQAVEYNQIIVPQSALNFAYKQMGVAMEGKFKKFSAQISFDPAKLANAVAHIDVDLASIDTGSIDADEEVAGKLWFNTKAYPTASFVSNGIKSLGGNQYLATGRLSIKGKTLNVSTPITVQSDAKKSVFDGSFIISRTTYAIGEGEWRDLGTVADQIQIKFHLVVNASAAKI